MCHLGVMVLWAFGREGRAHTNRRAVTCEIEVPVRLALD